MRSPIARPTLRVNRRGIALLLAAMLTLVPSVALAGGKWSASAPIQQGNAACGMNQPQLPVIGSVDFSRKGASLALTFHVAGGAANASYQASVWSGECQHLATLGTFTTDGSGNATASYTIRTRADSYFATIYKDGFNNTTIVP
jgi:hypothetical protein